MAFGIRFPSTFWYPSKVSKYKPLSVRSLQGCGNPAAADAVPGVSSAIAATRQPNAHVKARELIIVLVNLVFILILSCFGLPWLLVIEKSFLAGHWYRAESPSGRLRGKIARPRCLLRPTRESLNRNDVFRKCSRAAGGALPKGNQRYLETVSFGANEATIFSKRGSPRSGSHIGLRRKLP